MLNFFMFKIPREVSKSYTYQVEIVELGQGPRDLHTRRFLDECFS